MDTGAADARVFTGVIKIPAELEYRRMGKPDIADTMLPEVSVHELGDCLPDSA